MQQPRLRRPAALLAAVGALAVAATSRPALAQLVIDADLGTLSNEVRRLTGTTAGQANDVSTYGGPVPAGSTYNQGEFVYSFTLPTQQVLRVRQNTTNAQDGSNNDQILLTSTDASSAVGFVDESGALGLFDAGMYVLSVDAFTGGGGFTGSQAGPFDFDLSARDFAPPPSAPAELGGRATTRLEAGEVVFYRFEYDGSMAMFITAESTSDAGGPLDTELALFNSLGTLITTSDDRSPTNPTSGILVDANGLPSGTYFLAASASPTEFGDDFMAVSTSSLTGTLVVDGLTVIPEPAGAALLGLAGLAALRRRRA